MFKKRAIFTTLVALISLFSTSLSGYADNPPRKILTGWIPYYSKTGLPSAVANADLIQDVSPFWYQLTGEARIVDQYALGNPSVPISVPIQTLQSMNFNIIPTITDGTGKGVLAGLLASPTSRANIIKTITSLINQYNYQGIDLDFENFAFLDSNTTWPATAIVWTQFIQELSTALHAENKILSVTSPVSFDPTTGKRGYYVYAWPNIAQYIDRLRIMGYDYSTSSAGPIGPINWTEDAVKYAVSIIPASKIFLGFPGYGRDWITKVDGTCPSNVAAVIKVGASAATFAIHDAQGLIATYGATPTFVDKYGEVNFTYQKTYVGTTGAGLATQCVATRSAWYQDAKSVGLRAALVTKYHLGGIAEWALGMEDAATAQVIRDLAKTIAPDVVNANLVQDVGSISLGQNVTLTGTLTLKDTSPLAGVPVRIEAKNATTDWHPIFTGNTGQDGTVKVIGKFGANTSFRLVSDGTWDRMPSTSAQQDIKVSRLISWSAPSSMKAGVSYTIKGEVQPKVANVNVAIMINGKVVGNATTDVNGLFSQSISYDKIGIISLKLSVVGDQSLSDSSTNPTQVLVR